MVGPEARIVVVGLGPAGPEWIPPAALAAIAGAESCFLRTRWHPASEALPNAVSFDPIYDKASDYEEVYAEIVEVLVDAALRISPAGYVAYAVPGSPLVAEQSVVMLRKDRRVLTEIIPAMSFVDLAWERLGIDPVDEGVRLIDGSRFVVEAAGDRGPMLVAQCWTREVLSVLKLAVDAQPELGEDGASEVVVLQRLGCPDEAVSRVGWNELDRSFEPDHMTSLFIPSLAEPVASELTRLDELVRTLRERCPWDRKQTHRSLTKHLVEETYEVLDAIAELPDDGELRWDPGSSGPRMNDEQALVSETSEDIAEAYAHLEEELGDLLFQVFFHARLAAEQGRFQVSDVARSVHDKLVGRHPHVFGDVEVASAEEVLGNWERIKLAEKGRTSIMEGIATSLPSLAFAYKVQRKAASVGFDWPDCAGPLAKVVEEVGELKEALDSGGSITAARSELGDLLFSVVNLARHLGIDPEVALRGSAAVFRNRFQQMESRAAASGRPLAGMSLTELDELWEAVKGIHS